MVLEVAMLDVKPGLEADFEVAFGKAQKIISAMDGYVFHHLGKCVETAGRYVLLVNWRTLEDHTIGFRKSEQYKAWRELLHHFYDPFPTVEHFRHAAGGIAPASAPFPTSQEA